MSKNENIIHANFSRADDFVSKIKNRYYRKDSTNYYLEHELNDTLLFVENYFRNKCKSEVSIRPKSHTYILNVPLYGGLKKHFIECFEKIIEDKKTNETEKKCLLFFFGASCQAHFDKVFTINYEDAINKEMIKFANKKEYIVIILSALLLSSVIVNVFFIMS